MGIIDEIKGALSKEGISSRASEIKEVFTGGSGEYREVKSEEVKSEPKETEDTYEDVLAETGSYGTHVRKKIKGGISGIKKSAYSYAIRPFETEEEKGFRIKSEEQRKLEKATIGMNKQEKAAYEEAHLTQKRTKASEKAKRDVPIGETAEEKQKRLQKKRERKEEVAHAYQKSRASAAGAEAGKSAPPSIFGITRPENRELKSPTASGLVPHGFMPNVGMGAPGFRPQNLRPIGFEPIVPPTPQPERRMSRRELHRQQVREESERFKRELQQQYFQPNVYYPQTVPMPSHNGSRNGRQVYFRNPFESHQMKYHNPQEALPDNVAHVPMEAIHSANMLGMIPMGNGKAKGNGKKSKRSNIAPWEL